LPLGVLETKGAESFRVDDSAGACAVYVGLRSGRSFSHRTRSFERAQADEAVRMVEQPAARVVRIGEEIRSAARRGRVEVYECLHWTRTPLPVEMVSNQHPTSIQRAPFRVPRSTRLWLLAGQAPARGCARCLDSASLCPPCE